MQELASAVVLGVAALSALGLLIKWLRGGFRAAEDLNEIRAARAEIRELVAMTGDLKELVDQELNHNHGSSIKDDTYGAAVSAHLAHQRIDGIYDVLQVFAEANHLVLPIIADAINATPHGERTQI